MGTFCYKNDELAKLEALTVRNYTKMASRIA